MKRTILLCLCIAVIIVLTFTAHAHSGRTDENGGHYVGGTDEYHYHHGYGAHDHWDMDGDGDLDCPYEYNVKTTTKEVPYIPGWIYWVIGILFLVCLGMLVIIKSRNSAIHDMENRHRSEILSIKNACKNEIKECLDSIESLETIHTQIITAEKEHNRTTGICNRISTKSLHLSPVCSRVTKEYLLDFALENGMSLITALRILNLERECQGLPPLKNSEDEVNDY